MPVTLPPAPPAIIKQLHMPRPHAGQMSILAAQKKYNVVACGRRFGKTILGTNRLIIKAAEGYPVAWFAPNYKLLGPVWRDCLRRLKPLIQHVDKTERRIELVTGGTLEFWTLDGDDPARGREYALVVIDEAAMVPDLSDLWQAAIEPTLLTFDGEAWFLSTPKGLNFFHTLWQWGLSADYADWASHRAPTLANPCLKNVQQFLDRKKKTNDERTFQQEYLAEFLSGQGAVFRRVAKLATANTYSMAQPQRQYVAGLDFARSHDYTVVTVMDIASGEVVFVDRFTGIEFVLQQERIKAIWQRFRPSVMLCEQNSFGAANVEALQRMGLPAMPFLTTQGTKQIIIDGLALALEQEQIQLPPSSYTNDDGEQLGQIVQNEMLAFEGTKTRGGMMQYGAPAGFNDDCVISLALCEYARASGVVEYSESPI